MAEPTTFTGVWTNWTHGPVLGATWTLPARDGSFVIAFLALFVRMVGGQCWDILCFIMHRLRCTDKPSDGLYYQQQVELRNSASSTRTLLDLIRLSWYWRRTRNSLSRSVALMAVALVHVLGFVAAGLFSSRVATSSTEVLVRSPNCGDFSATFENQGSQERMYAISVFTRMQSFYGSNYAFSCYGKPAGTAGCEIFSTQQLNLELDHETTCPFASGMCLDSDTGAFSIDTGFVDSNTDLGINAPLEDRITWRKVTTCAPLVINSSFVSDWENSTSPSDHSLVYNFEKNLPGDQFKYYWYGEWDTLDYNGTSQNQRYTFRHSRYSESEVTEPYVLLPTLSFGGGNGSWKPIPELLRTDADVTLVFLENYAVYTNPVSDPWFKATRSSKSDPTTAEFVPGGLAANNAVTVMGCTEQYQFCNPSSPQNHQCSQLGGIGPLPTDELQLPTMFNKRQAALARRLRDAVSMGLIYVSLLNLGSTALNAQEYLGAASELKSAPLPSDQWKVEVLNWHNISMATAQRAVLDWVTGPYEAAYNRFVEHPTTPEGSNMCLNQKTRSSGHYNFSLVGILIILTVGMFIVCLNLSLPRLTDWLSRRRHKGDYARRAWAMDETLQLHRMAFEGAKLGTWTGKDGSVPVTLPGEKFLRPHGHDHGSVAYSPLRGSVDTDHDVCCKR